VRTRRRRPPPRQEPRRSRRSATLARPGSTAHATSSSHSLAEATAALQRLPLHSACRCVSPAGLSIGARAAPERARQLLTETQYAHRQGALLPLSAAEHAP
jgi:hypothetical protein